MTRSKTNRLRNAQKNRAITVVTNSTVRVTYQPRHEKDDQPWVSDQDCRYSGTECSSAVE